MSDENEIGRAQMWAQLLDEHLRLRRVEKLALEMFALDNGAFTNADAFDAKYEELKLVVNGKV